MCVAKMFIRSAGVAVVRTGETPKILLMRRCLPTYAGKTKIYGWELPKGKVLQGEKAKEVAVAKLQKETGVINVKPENLHYIHSSTYDMNEYLPAAEGENQKKVPATKSVEYFGYKVETPEIDLSLRDKETARVEWYTPKEAKDLRYRNSEVPAIVRSAFGWVASINRKDKKMKEKKQEKEEKQKKSEEEEQKKSEEVEQKQSEEKKE
eukprot:TRINITY_DN23351_c0_g1_i1.p1 TRINITY_DN23351_c0_g1~~TRINITY_DN23351_c0_g1_i1.p1  ORF type:complete len:208 (+),score=60.74 TRINITY_DN23351_c0_g1_i1:52-675(+)